MIRIPSRPVVAPASPVPPSSTPAELKHAAVLLKRIGFKAGELKDFQIARGLPATGLLDPKTSALLAATATRVQAHRGDEFVSIGQKSSSIQVLERRLGRLGYATGKADGIYGRDTSAAVKAFRKDQKELTDGHQWLGKKARQVLREEVAKMNHAPERRRLAPTKSQARLDRATARAAAHGIAVGAKGGVVTNIQRHLRAAGFDPKHTSGVFDERTGAALKAFQQRSHLSATGTLDAAT